MPHILSKPIYLLFSPPPQKSQNWLGNASLDFALLDGKTVLPTKMGINQMAKVYIRFDADNISAKAINATFRKDAVDTMFKSTRIALQRKCQVDLEPRPVPKSGLSLSGAVESIETEPVGTQTKVKVKINMQLASWPAPSDKSKTAEDLFGFMTGSSATIDGSTSRQIIESVKFAVADAAQKLILNRLDAGLLAWQQKTNAKLDKCEEAPKP